MKYKVLAAISVVVIILGTIGNICLFVPELLSFGEEMIDDDYYEDEDDFNNFDEDEGEHGLFDEGDTLPGELYDDFGNGGEFDEDSQDASGGVEAIPEYIDEDVSYTLDEATYSFTDEEKTSTYITFEVAYPTVTGLKNSNLEDKINDALKKVAMESVDELYDNPTEEVKETVLSSDNPVLASTVDYKVTYASKNLLSVVYEDYSYRGNANNLCYNLRTLNISLKDGTIFEVKDILDMDQEFLDEWLSVMRDEVGNDKFLSELSDEELKEALKGDSKDGVYVANFFVDKDGIEIGFDLNYKADDSNDLGYLWVTAPFQFDEIEKYQNDSEFWSLY